MNAEHLRPMLTLHTRAVSEVCARSLDPGVVEAWLSGRSPQGYLRAAEAGENFLVAVDEAGAVRGYASWKAGEVVSLFVDPDHHGRGVGRRLLAACDRAACAANTPILRVDSTLNAVGFYESAGFRRIRDGDRIKGGVRIPHVEMARETDPCSP